MHASAWTESNWTEHDKQLNMGWEIYGRNKNHGEKKMVWFKSEATIAL